MITFHSLDHRLDVPSCVIGVKEAGRFLESLISSLLASGSFVAADIIDGGVGMVKSFRFKIVFEVHNEHKTQNL
jgi:hypothetical protein